MTGNARNVRFASDGNGPFRRVYSDSAIPGRAAISTDRRHQPPISSLMRTPMGLRVAVVMLCAVACAQLSPVAGSPPVANAQGDRGTVRDQALAAYASGNVHLRQRDLNAASRDLNRAIAAEKQFFASLGTIGRQGESSYFIEYLTLAGVTDYGLGRRALAFTRWSAAGELYRQYLPRLDGRLAAADALVERRRCSNAFASYAAVSFLARDPELSAVLRAGRAARWAEAKAAAATMRGTPEGDYFAGVVASCTRGSARAAEIALVAALTDYSPTTSETPNVGPLQASAIRLLGGHTVR